MTTNIGIAEDKTYQPFIDGMRGIALLMVFAVHTSQFCGNNDPNALKFHFMQDYLNAGARGVQLFFILSAYTLFASSKVRFAEEALPVRSFYIRRAFRILPFWWLVTILYMILNGTGLIANLPNFLMYFGFIRYDPQVEAFPLGWTIFTEETFYLFLPLIFAYITDIYRAIWLFGAALFLAYGWNFAAPHFRVPQTNAFVFLFPFNHWFCFPLGIILFYIKSSPFFEPYFLKNRQALVLADAAALFTIWYCLTADLQLACVPLFLMFISATSEKTIFGKIARNPLLMRFGTYCYSIYLLHRLLLMELDPVKFWLFDALHISHSSVEVRFAVWFPIMGAVALCAGFLSFNLVEKPCVRLGKWVIARFIQGKVTARAVA